MPVWIDAMKAGTKAVEQEFSIELDLETAEIRNRLNSRMRSFIKADSRNLERSIESILQKCRKRGFNSTQTAYAIRPVIGLYPRQAASNWRFQRTFVKYLSNPIARRRKSPALKNTISEELRELQEKLEGALDYSLEQIQHYARMLVKNSLTEMYNTGKHEIIRQSMEHGLVGVCEKIWVTASDQKVCRDCFG